MFVCLDPIQGWFARIVTREPRHWPVRLHAGPEHGFLDHDSYVETGIPVEFYDDDIEEAEARDGVLGRISADAARRMMNAWAEAEVTPPAARDVILQQLRETFGL